MNLKDAIAGKRTSGMPLARMVNELSEEISERQVLDNSLSNIVVSTESMGDVERTHLTTAATSLVDSFEAISAQLGYDFKASDHNVEAGAIGALLATAGRKALARRMPTPPSGGDHVVVMESYGSDDSYAGRNINFEAYDETENKMSAIYTFFYNMINSTQSPVAELFFPTVVISPDQHGLELQVTLLSVFDEVEHQTAGTITDFKFKNVLRAFRDHTVLKSDVTKVVPVFRPGTNDAVFMDSGLTVGTPGINPNGSFVGDAGGEVVDTLPLKPGQRLNLLGISQTNGLLAKGIMDETDALDTGIYLDSIYVKLADDGLVPPTDVDMLKLNTRGLPGANFTYSTQGHNRDMVLTLNTTSLVISGNPVCIDGAAPSQVIWPAGYSARIRLEASGTANLQRGDMVVYFTRFELDSVYDANNDIVPATDANHIAIKTIIDAAVVSGYELDANRTNTNRRQRGQIIDVSTQTTIYPVRLRSPISSIRPIGYGDDEDSKALEALNTTTRIRTSKDAITALLDASDVLSSWMALPNSNNELPEVLGTGRYLVQPYYAQETVDMTTVVDSVMSSNRQDDIRAALMGKIMDHAYRMWSESEYSAAFDSFGGPGVRPTVIIATDTVLYRYLKASEGSDISTDAFDVRIAADQDSRLTGKIFISFGIFNDQRNKTPNPLNFGNMGWAPEVTAVLPVSRGGQVSKELTVCPRYQHVVNLPCMVRLDVTNLETVLNKVTINNAI